MNQYIDTHTHLYDSAYDEDIDEVIKKSTDTGVIQMIMPDIDSKDRPLMINLFKKYPDLLKTMRGLHPLSVDNNFEKELQLVYDSIENNIVAIGEVGLDYHYSKEYANQQHKALISLFELAKELHLPLNIHLRDATEDFIKLVKEYSYLGLYGNIHAFNCSYETYQILQKYGDWYVGIGGVITFKNSKLYEVVEKIPIEKILLETDSPYLTPTPFRGTRNDSSYLSLIAQKIADVKGMSLEEVAYRTNINANTLFNLGLEL